MNQGIISPVERIKDLEKLGWETDWGVKSLTLTILLESRAGVCLTYWWDSEELFLLEFSFENGEVKTEQEYDMINTSINNLENLAQPYLNRGFDWRQCI